MECINIEKLNQVSWFGLLYQKFWFFFLGLNQRKNNFLGWLGLLVKKLIKSNWATIIDWPNNIGACDKSKELKRLQKKVQIFWVFYDQISWSWAVVPWDQQKCT